MSDNKEQLLGHLAAVIGVSVWGTTFISSKVLLDEFSPVEVLVIRFVIGLLVLCIAEPRRMRLRDWKKEVNYMLAGLTGVTLYYFVETVALTYTFAANVGVIVSTAPFFTVLVLHFFTKEKEELFWTFFLEFAVALTGIGLISFNGAAFHVNPLGDFLTVIAAVCWAFYAPFLKKINTYGYSSIQNTRRIFFWGLVFMIPLALMTGFKPNIQKLTEPLYLGNFLFLGIGACALCFVIWNYAVQVIGAVKTSIYIYLDPVIAVIVSACVLDEPATGLMIIGTILTLVGLAISEMKPVAYKGKGIVPKTD